LTKGAEDDISLCVLSGFSSYRQQKVYTDNHSGISTRQRDSKVSMTDLMSAEDNINLRVSTGLYARLTKGAEDDISQCVLSGFSSYRQQKVYTDNHSGISARQRDSKVSMTDLVSAEDDVNLRMSTGLSAAIDEGRRRRH